MPFKPLRSFIAALVLLAFTGQALAALANRNFQVGKSQRRLLQNKPARVRKYFQHSKIKYAA